jgi:hypothetical protein
MPFKNLFKCLQRQDPEDFFDVEDFMITRIIPVEIMEFVFVELSIKDIRSCLRTCIRWNHIIHAMFKNKSKSIHSYLFLKCMLLGNPVNPCKHLHCRVSQNVQTGTLMLATSFSG